MLLILNEKTTRNIELQAELSTEPIRVENLPAKQVTHVEIDVAPIDPEYVPSTQSMHILLVDAPAKVEYFPAGH